MTKPVIVTRLGKGSELSFQEGDDNFTNLKNATITVAGDSGSAQAIDLNGTVTVSGGTGLSSAATTNTITVNLDNTAVTPGAYTNANVTVDAQGRLTSAANGFSGSYNDLTSKPTLFSGSYTDLTSKPTIPTNNNELTNGAGYITGINSGAVTTALGFTPESTSNKNQNNGYAGLDAGGKVASAQLPSYVDDVVESANLAALPGSGETGKIYVTLDTNKTYRWSGSAYVEISPSPGSTDSVTEGSTNLYFTTVRARGAFSASTGISITDGAISATGGFSGSYTDLTNKPTIPSTLDSLTDVNTTGVSNNHVLKYNSSATEWQSSLLDVPTTLDSLTDVSTSGVSNQQLLSYNSSTSSWEPRTVTAGISSVISDTTPSLGGNLNVNGNSIISGSNGNISITPNGTGQTIVKNLEYQENVYAIGTTSGTVAPDVANGNIQTITLNGNLTINAFTNPVSGQSLTLVITTGGTGRTLTSSMLFAGASKTLSTTSTVDILTISYIGTTYYASLGKGFA